MDGAVPSSNNERNQHIAENIDDTAKQLEDLFLDNDTKQAGSDECKQEKTCNAAGFDDPSLLHPRVNPPIPDSRQCHISSWNSIWKAKAREAI